MKCRYEIEVFAQCPVNPEDRDRYQFALESESIIEVEKIIAFFKTHADKARIFQEALTLQCAVTIGTRVSSVGWHSGVKVTCEAP